MATWDSCCCGIEEAKQDMQSTSSLCAYSWDCAFGTRIHPASAKSVVTAGELLGKLAAQKSKLAHEKRTRLGLLELRFEGWVRASH